MNSYRITKKRFSPELCAIASEYGFKSVGPFKKHLLKCSPNAIFISHLRDLHHPKKVRRRATRLTKELDRFLARRG